MVGDARTARAELDRLLSVADIDVPPGFGDAIERYVELLLAANARTNLTRVVEPAAVARLHLLDALAALPILDALAPRRAIDLGTGGGVPGIVLALARPSVGWILVDAVAKKADAVRGFVAELERPDVRVVAARAEDLGRDGAYREAVDLVVARACAALPVLAEYALPLVRPGGALVAWKGPTADAEVLDAGPAIDRLGGGDAKVRSVSFPELGDHRLVTVPKVGRTPDAYPRRPGVPSRRPLG